jgi:hypothetical protein
MKASTFLHWVNNLSFENVTKEELQGILLKCLEAVNDVQKSELEHKIMIQKCLSELKLARDIIREVEKNKGDQNSELLRIVTSYNLAFKKIWGPYIF